MMEKLWLKNFKALLRLKNKSMKDIKMIVRVTHNAGVASKVLIDGLVSDLQPIVETEFVCTDMVDATNQWTGMYSGANTIPTNQIILIEIISD